MSSAQSDEPTLGDQSAQVTVVIVNYNGAHLLGPCLSALDAQRPDAPVFDTIVVDNASTDGSLALVTEQYPWVRVIASEVNTGFAGGNNLALREVPTPYVALLNNDATPEPGWLANLLAPFQDGDPTLGMTTGKIVFMPRFVALDFRTPGFSPGPHDTRELGVRIYRVEIDGVDVAPKSLWEASAYGVEPAGPDTTYRWTRPAGRVLIPVPAEATTDGLLHAPLTLGLFVAAEKTKQLQLNGDDVEVGEQPSLVEVVLPVGTPAVDVVNNVGGIVLTEGYGADRGFQEPDTGQYEQPEEVFTGCGNGLAMPTELGNRLGWFDEDFFMYYEDADLSWRVRALGYRIEYVPTAVLRHVHAASSKEWSPRWVFHVDRNRLLMLTKDASARLALSAVLRYPLTSASMAVRAAIEGVRVRRRPAVRPHLLRLTVLASYLRLLPRMLARRRTIGASAQVSRADLEKWLVSR